MSRKKKERGGRRIRRWGWWGGREGGRPVTSLANNPIIEDEAYKTKKTYG